MKPKPPSPKTEIKCVKCNKDLRNKKKYRNIPDKGWKCESCYMSE